MPSKIRHGLLISVALITLLFTSLPTIRAQTVNYVYDDLNRLIRVEYGNGVVIEYEYDKAGNRLERMSGTGADTQPPTGTVTINGGAAFTNTTGVTLALTCSDTGWGCVYMQFSNGGSYSAEEWYATSKSWILASGDGPKTVWARFRDGAGNWSSDPPPSDSIILDTIPPTGTIFINNNATSTNIPIVTLNLTCNDANGCTEMKFSNDNPNGPYSDPEAYSITRNNWTLSPGDGTKTVYVKFGDGAGNWSDPAANDSIVLDTLGPSGSIQINGGAAITHIPDVTLNLTCADALSGCVSMQFSNVSAGGPYSDLEPYATTKVGWMLSPGDGTKTVYVRFQDGAGNLSNSPLRDSIDLVTIVKIGGTPYNSIQAAYNQASDGAVIKCRQATLSEDLTANLSKNITLEGGYNAAFTSNYGTMTTLQGMITITNGTLTIKDFTLVQ